MKQNNIKNKALLFISHIYVYSFFYLLINEVIVFVKTDFYTVYFEKFDFSNVETYFKLFKDFIFTLLLCPLGLIFVEGLFVLLIPVIFFILKFKLNSINEFKIYLISATSTALITYSFLWFDSYNYLNIVVMRYDGRLEYNKLYFFEILLLSILLCNLFYLLENCMKL